MTDVVVTTPAAARPWGGPLAGLWTLARPRQWVKNVLVLAAPVAAGRWAELSVAAAAAWALLSFTATTAGCYMLNDARDAARDRWHPDKRRRPVASGAVPAPLAVAVGAALTLAGPALALAAGYPSLALVVAAYAALTTAYTVWLKQVPGVELATVSAGFVLRPLAGAAACAIPPSNWFLGVVCAGSLMVVVGKREAEIVLAGAAQVHRVSLRGYTAASLRRLRTLAAAGLLACYAGWAVTRSAPDIDAAALSAAAVTAGVLRYGWCARRGRAGAPERLAAHDRVLQLAGLCWLAVFLLGPGRG